MEKKEIILEKEDVLKLLRLEENILKDKLIKERIYKKNSLQSKNDLFKSKITYEEAIDYIKNISEADREDYRNFVRRLAFTNNFITGFSIGTIIGGLINENILEVIFCGMTIFFAQGINKVGKQTLDVIDEINNKKEKKVDESIITKENYSVLTKIGNIENAISFLQELPERETKKYLKLKLINETK